MSLLAPLVFAITLTTFAFGATTSEQCLHAIRQNVDWSRPGDPSATVLAYWFLRDPQQPVSPETLKLALRVVGAMGGINHARIFNTGLLIDPDPEIRAMARRVPYMSMPDFKRALIELDLTDEEIDIAHKKEAAAFKHTYFANSRSTYTAFINERIKEWKAKIEAHKGQLPPLQHRLKATDEEINQLAAKMVSEILTSLEAPVFNFESKKALELIKQPLCVNSPLCETILLFILTNPSIDEKYRLTLAQEYNKQFDSPALIEKRRLAELRREEMKKVKMMLSAKKRLFKRLRRSASSNAHHPGSQEK